MAPKAAGTVSISRQDVLTWSAASDTTSGVAGYLLSLDGRETARVAGTVTSTTVSTPVGRHVWSVTAADRAGNLAQPVAAPAVWRDPTAPTGAAFTALAQGATVAGTSLTVTWTAASDPDSRVSGFVLSVSGATTRTVTTTGTSTTVPVARGRTTVPLVVVNAAGVASDPVVVHVVVV